jgi:hypothetical protein
VEVPFADVGPVSFLLGFVEVGIEVNDEFLDEGLSQLTGFEFRADPSSLEFKIFLFLDISSDCG